MVPNIGAPTIGAALKLANMLEPEYRTEIVGPDFGGGVCSLYRDAYPFTALPAGKLYRYPDYFWEREKLAEAVQGDVVVAVKGFAATVPVALKVREQRGVPVAVYLDEWDGALWYGLSAGQKIGCWLRHVQHPDEACYMPRIEKQIHRANTVISTTTWLQKRFGGHVVHAGVDCGFFRPQDPDRVAVLKSELGLTGKKVIVFGGVVRPHKGVEEILESLNRLGRDDIRLLIVGPVTEHLDSMMKSSRDGKWIVVAGDPVNAKTTLNADIHRQMPLYLDVGDLVVLPLRDTLLAQSQMPIKIFEAMAMGKPVVGTEVADLPLMLKDCGLIVPPGDNPALAAAIENVVDDEGLAARLGDAARKKCEQEFDATVSREHLQRIIAELLASRGRIEREVVGT